MSSVLLGSWSYDSVYGQLRFSLYSGAVITRTQFSYNTFIDDSFLALDLSYALCLVSSLLQHRLSYVLDCSLTLCSPLSWYLLILSGSTIDWLPLWGLWLPFYLGYSPIEPWDSLSAYVHPGIACLASQASDWLGAFWASLSGFQSSMTHVKLLVIGQFLWPLGWST